MGPGSRIQQVAKPRFRGRYWLRDLHYTDSAHSRGVWGPCGLGDPSEGFYRSELFRNKTKMLLHLALVLTRGKEFSETLMGDEIIALYVYLGILVFKCFSVNL